MLPAVRRRITSRVSLYNVIPPIGAPIYNFENYHENVWLILQQIKEMEKAISQQSVRKLTPNQELDFLALILEKREEDDVVISINDSVENEKSDFFHDPSSSSDTEAEFSLAGAVQNPRFRYSTSDQEALSDGESSGVALSSRAASGDSISGNVSSIQESTGGQVGKQKMTS